MFSCNQRILISFLQKKFLKLFYFIKFLNAGIVIADVNYIKSIVCDSCTFINKKRIAGLERICNLLHVLDLRLSDNIIRSMIIFDFFVIFKYDVPKIIQ